MQELSSRGVLRGSAWLGAAGATGGLPARPLGPGGVIWYAAGDQRQLVLAIRLLLHQVAHPMVGAGVEQQSVYKTDPYGRLWRTTLSVVKSVYGGAASAEEGYRLLRGPLQQVQRDVIAVTLDPDLRARIGLPAPTPAARRRVARLQRLSRLGNPLPEPARLSGLAWWRAWRTRHDGITEPEPVRYP